MYFTCKIEDDGKYHVKNREGKTVAAVSQESAKAAKDPSEPRDKLGEIGKAAGLDAGQMVQLIRYGILDTDPQIKKR